MPLKLCGASTRLSIADWTPSVVEARDDGVDNINIRQSVDQFARGAGISHALGF